MISLCSHTNGFEAGASSSVDGALAIQFASCRRINYIPYTVYSQPRTFDRELRETHPLIGAAENPEKVASTSQLFYWANIEAAEDQASGLAKRLGQKNEIDGLKQYC